MPGMFRNDRGARLPGVPHVLTLFIPTLLLMFLYHYSYLMLIILGHIRDFFGKRFDKKSFGHLMPSKVGSQIVVRRRP